MLTPTFEQQCRIVFHRAWDLMDDGLADEQVIEALIETDAPREKAEWVVSFVRDAQTQSVHTDEQRGSLLDQLQQALFDENFDAIREVILAGADDQRTTHKLLSKLSDSLLSESQSEGTAAAYGLSIFVGQGDWPLIQAMAHEDETVRCRAAFALGKMGQHAQRAIPVLLAAIDDPDDYVRVLASEALESIENDMKPWWKFW
jgi:hypothetical protein